MQDSIGRIIKIVGFLIVPVGILLFLSQRAIEGTTTSDAIVNTVAGVIGMIPEAGTSDQCFIYFGCWPSGKKAGIGAGDGSY